MENIKFFLHNLKEWFMNYEDDIDFILRMESEYDIYQMKRKLESENSCN